MGAVEINGYPLPVATGNLARKPVPIGELGRVTSGAYRDGRKKTKYDWSLSTPPLVGSDADKVRAMLRGDGYQMRLGLNSYTTKGLAVTTDNDVIYEPATAGDGSLVQWKDPTTDKPRAFSSGTGLAWFRGQTASGGSYSSTNLLSAALRDAEGTPSSDYTAIDSATLSADTSNYWQGTQSVKCITSGTVNSVKGGLLASITATASARYSGAVYLKGSGGVEVYLRDNTNGTNSAKTSITLSSTVWTRVAVEDFQVGAGTPTLQLRVEESTADSNITFYADGWSIEKNGFANAWSDGTSSANGGYLDYGAAFAQYFHGKSYSIGAWLWLPYQGTYPSLRYAWAIGSAAQFIAVYYDGTYIYADWDGSSGTNTLSGTPPATDQFFQVTITYNVETDAVALYADGTLLDSSTLTGAQRPLLSASTAFILGNYHSTPYADGSLCGGLNDFFAVPWCMSADEVSWIYNYGAAMPALPKLALDGDTIPTATVVVPEIQNVKSVQMASGGAWYNNAEQFDVVLHEV